VAQKQVTIRGCQEGLHKVVYAGLCFSQETLFYARPFRFSPVSSLCISAARSTREARSPFARGTPRRWLIRGVGPVSRAIAENKGEAYALTSKANSVAVVTNGSAVLGLGNLGPRGRPARHGGPGSGVAWHPCHTR